MKRLAYSLFIPLSIITFYMLVTSNDMKVITSTFALWVVCAYLSIKWMIVVSKE